MRSLATLALVVALLASTFTAVASNGGFILVYGAQTCPASRTLKSVLEKARIRYVFVDLERCGVGEYEEIVRLFSLQPIIPLSIVFTPDGRPAYVVTGAFTNLDKWLGMIYKHPKSNTIVVNDRAVEDPDAVRRVAEIARRTLETCVGDLFSVIAITPPGPSEHVSTYYVGDLSTTTTTPETSWHTPAYYVAVAVATATIAMLLALKKRRGATRE